MWNEIDNSFVFKYFELKYFELNDFDNLIL